jgi:hypothetical protein
VAARAAHVLAAVAAEAAVAAHDDAVVAKLTAAYAKQQARKLAKAARAAARAVKKAAKKLAHAAVTVAKAAYKYSGAQDVVSCVTNPHLSSCVKAAVTVALVVATAGEGEVEVAAMNAAEEGGADVAEQVGAKVAESCGLSFSPGTKVLLANGKAVPISALKPGEKVVSTSTKTGKTQAGTIAAVLVHHDTNLYDLTVRARGRTAVIHTTSNHPFWDVTTHRWVKAGALRYGTYLRTPAGGTATALGGHAPRHRSGWMWDLTVQQDHDFYVIPGQTAGSGGEDQVGAAGMVPVLVHNCNESWEPHYEKAGDLPGKYTPGQATRDPSSQWYHEMLSDGDLLSSINHAEEGDGIAVSREGTILGGHHRLDELLTRVGDGRIDPNTPIRIDVLRGGEP